MCAQVDLPDSDKLLDKLRQELLASEVMLEDMGGDVPLVPVSATKKIGLDALKEAILFQAEGERDPSSEREMPLQR